MSHVPGLELRRSSGVAVSAVEQHSAFQLHPLIWDTVKEHLNPSEIDEIKAIIGAQLIDDNETVQIEIQSLIEIWNDFRKTVDEKLDSIAKPRSALPEPPGRELLERKIMIMINRLEQKSAIRGKQIDMDVVPTETPREKEIVDYISIRKQQPTRPKSASPRDGRPATASPRDPVTGKPLSLPPDVQAPLDTRPAPLTPRSSGATISIDKIRSKLNVYDVESIKDQLQEALREEHTMLVDDAAYLQKCLDDEMLYQREAESYAKKMSTRTPALQELQEFGTKLEKKLLAEKEQRELRNAQHQQTPPSPSAPRPRSTTETASPTSRAASSEPMPPPPARRMGSGRLEPLSPLRQSQESLVRRQSLSRDSTSSASSQDSLSRESTSAEPARRSIDLSAHGSERPP
eukprot:TRINITY_DN4734_c0_g1_i2.p1 TRINITY_DN4734_c0_g1~~TRINITY_DN4734_c0_g1_i2.p1  ORF type:complete len:403 (-),score=91.59 TRINITY_DN4734_c0_g1_i2:354-1562(-)